MQTPDSLLDVGWVLVELHDKSGTGLRYRTVAEDLDTETLPASNILEASA